MDLKRLCEVLGEYFVDHNFNVKFQYGVLEDINLVVKEKEICRLCFSLIFYKTSISKEAVFDVKFKLYGNKMRMSIEDNGFKINHHKMVSYLENIVKPSFVLDWWQVVLKLESSKIHLTQGSEGSINFMFLDIPLASSIPKKDSKEGKICYVDFR